MKTVHVISLVLRQDIVGYKSHFKHLMVIIRKLNIVIYYDNCFFLNLFSQCST